MDGRIATGLAGLFVGAIFGLALGLAQDKPPQPRVIVRATATATANPHYVSPQDTSKTATAAD